MTVVLFGNNKTQKHFSLVNVVEGCERSFFCNTGTEHYCFLQFPIISDERTLVAIKSSLGIEKPLCAHIDLKDLVSSFFVFKSDFGSLDKLFLLHGSLAQEKSLSLCSEVRGRNVREFLVNNAIDFNINRQLQLLNKIANLDLFKNIRLPTDMSPTVVRDGITVLADGVDITSKVLEASITVFNETEVVSSFSCTIKSETFISIEKMSFLLHGSTLDFLVDEAEFSPKDGMMSVWGRALACKYLEPHAVGIDVDLHGETVSSVLQKILPGADISYGIDDWVVDSIEEADAIPLTLAKSIVSEAGGAIRGLPDGKIYVVYPNNSPALNVDTVLSLKIKQVAATATSVEVKSDTNSSVSISAEKTTVSPGEWVTVKVYSDTPYSLDTTADKVALVAKRQKEVVTESITMENGEGTISKPVLRVLEVRGCSEYEIKKQKITSNTCSFVEIDYETCFDVYVVTNFKEAKKLICTVQAQNGVLLKVKDGKKLTIDTKYSNDVSVLRRRAYSELEKAASTRLCEIETVFKPDFLVPALNIAIDGQIYEVVYNNIQIQANPLRIKTFLGARKCLQF